GSVSALMLGAEAADLGNNTGVASDVTVNVISDPLTSVQGRVVMTDGKALGGATVTCVGRSTQTLSPGGFVITTVPTVQPIITCDARFVSGTGVIFGGRSIPKQAVRGG